jgi:glyoxylase-like metal-dependent hydrolase (beta-lactamase superfamily II)
LIEYKAVSLLRNRRKRLLKGGIGEIIPGVEATPLPGHTPGSIGVLIDQGPRGRWLFCGDACKNRQELRSGLADHFLDREAGERSLAALRSMASRILPGHDGWLEVRPDGSIGTEPGTGFTLVLGKGLTANGGAESINVTLDD